MSSTQMNVHSVRDEYINLHLKAEELLEIEHFKSILGQVLDEITIGKGAQRHGHNIKFSEQPWKYITDGVGTGFTIGQAIKKLIELKAYHEKEFPNTIELVQWKREALGAIVYIIMTIMWYENKFKKLVIENDNREKAI